MYDGGTGIDKVKYFFIFVLNRKTSIMKKLLLVIIVIVHSGAWAQKPLGIFGKQNSIGMSFDMTPLQMYRYSKGGLLFPTIQYTRVKTYDRSFTYELGYVSLNLKDNNSGADDQLLKVLPYDEPKGYDPPDFHRVTAKGSGRVSALAFGVYRVAANWVGLGPMGSYHTWGFHVASLKDNFKYQYENYTGQVIDTFYNGPHKPSRLVMSLSLGFGGKTSVGKSTRVVWDYGIRFKVPVFGFYKAYKYFDDGRKYLLYHGVKAYMAGTFMMVYTGFHYAF